MYICVCGCGHSCVTETMGGYSFWESVSPPYTRWDVGIDFRLPDLAAITFVSQTNLMVHRSNSGGPWTLRSPTSAFSTSPTSKPLQWSFPLPCSSLATLIDWGLGTHLDYSAFCSLSGTINFQNYLALFTVSVYKSTSWKFKDYKQKAGGRSRGKVRPEKETMDKVRGYIVYLDH